LTSTTGILFLGTPFRGANQELSQGAILQAARRQYGDDLVQKQSLKILRPENEDLSDLMDCFNSIQQEAYMPNMICFYEEIVSDIGKSGKEFGVEGIYVCK
jgi:disulfide oxidoreductase YuzD